MTELAVILAQAADADLHRRVVVGIAGIAGSGKSTLAQQLAGALGQRAVFLPMDGFHRPNAELDAQGWRSRKGAPWTYDAAAYGATLERFADMQNTGAFPVYCREAHEPVPGDQPVTADTRVIVTEGQYLLYDHDDWRGVANVLTHRWWLEMSRTHAQAWLMQRDTSVGRTVAQAQAKYANNDALNTTLVQDAKLPAQRVLKWPD